MGISFQGAPELSQDARPLRREYHQKGKFEQWVIDQRTKKRRGQLAESARRRLDEIGFFWDGRDAHRARVQKEQVDVLGDQSKDEGGEVTAKGCQVLNGWLAELGLKDAASKFSSEKIDASVLCECTEENLQTLGVATMGDRLRLMRRAREYSVAREYAAREAEEGGGCGSHK